MRISFLISAIFFVGCGGLLPKAPGVQPPDGGGAVTPRPRFHDYIRGDRHTRLVLEVDSVAGFEPRTSTQDAVRAQLVPLLDKPGGISVTRDGTIASRGADHAWTFAELDALAKETFDLQVEADTTKMHVLFVDGHSADDTSGGKILGLAWAHTHLVIFKKTIEDMCRSGISAALSERLCANAEHGVWIHEIGHLLGLVANGLPMVHDHKDPDHGAHDRSQDCVMYWAYDSGTLVDDLRSRLLGGNDAQLDFDAACRDDVAALRNQ